MAELDPRHLPRSFAPAIVHLADQELFVADADVLDSGWLRIRGWQESRELIPPGRIKRVERVAVERTSRDTKVTVGIVDDALCEQARQTAEPPTPHAGGGSV